MIKTREEFVQRTNEDGEVEGGHYLIRFCGENLTVTLRQKFGDDWNEPTMSVDAHTNNSVPHADDFAAFEKAQNVVMEFFKRIGKEVKHYQFCQKDEIPF